MVDGETWPPLGPSRGARGRRRRIRCGRARGDCPADEGVAVALGVWPGGKEPAAALCRFNADGTLTVVTGVVDMSGTTSAFAVDRRRDVRRVGRCRGRRQPRYRRRAPVADERRQRRDLLGRAGGPRGRGRRAAATAGIRRASRWRSIRPTSRSSTASSGRRARRTAADRWPSSPRCSTTSAVATPRSRATPRRSRRASRPSTSAHLAHVRLDRQTGEVDGSWVRRRPGRRAGAQPGARRGPDARRGGAGHRLGAPRGADPRRRRPAAQRVAARLRGATRGTRSRHRHPDRGGAGAGRAVRREGDRRGAGHPGRGGHRIGDRGRRGPAPADLADDPDARLGGHAERRGPGPDLQ